MKTIKALQVLASIVVISACSSGYSGYGPGYVSSFYRTGFYWDYYHWDYYYDYIYDWDYDYDLDPDYEVIGPEYDPAWDIDPAPELMPADSYDSSMDYGGFDDVDFGGFEYY
ncbi:hypothetical protein [Paraferrimonas sedimenticola]|uniref:Lipoprotein n=1 Tax=Paraferrimonas sedimenticola TaxID=375674 RepID=A0AA37RZJ8_9GAMM|nr:hypothetical protein [Paraferrimonas sedimenticola]GLP97923.1 hypothetical protein GCM10007895_32300 [Paraferrimonas sedimenticola]